MKVDADKLAAYGLTPDVRADLLEFHMNAMKNCKYRAHNSKEGQEVASVRIHSRTGSFVTLPATGKDIGVCQSSNQSLLLRSNALLYLHTAGKREVTQPDTLRVWENLCRALGKAAGGAHEVAVDGVEIPGGEPGATRRMSTAGEVEMLVMDSTTAPQKYHQDFGPQTEAGGKVSELRVQPFLGCIVNVGNKTVNGPEFLALPAGGMSPMNQRTTTEQVRHTISNRERGSPPPPIHSGEQICRVQQAPRHPSIAWSRSASSSAP